MLICIALVIVDPCKMQRFENFCVIMSKLLDMPEISRFYGIIITMYLPDHNPPHFYVRYNEHRATIDIQTGAVTGQMPRRALQLVFEWLDRHQDELMANWQRMVEGKPLVTINPLD